jgi:hypothetical protein
MRKTYKEMVIKIAILDVGPFLIGKSSELYYIWQSVWGKNAVMRFHK